MKSFLQICRNTVRNPRFAQLEPPANAGRSGGRGKKGSKRVKKRVQNAFFIGVGESYQFFQGGKKSGGVARFLRQKK